MRTLSVSFVLLLFTSAFYAQVYNIVDFGAVGDGKTLNTTIIQRAIDSCASTGGGTVRIPKGTFITGTLILKSKINLHLDPGAELKGSSRIDDYKKYQRPGYDETRYGIIYALKADHVSITGLGIINGHEEAFFEWDKAKKIEWGGSLNTRQKDKFRSVASGIGDGPVVPKDRPRQMVIFSSCTNVVVRDVSLIKSPFWTLHFADCDGVIASGIKIITSLDTPNSDGLDITSCNHVTVSDCDIRCGDDAIAITGYAHHFELPGYENLRHASGNITISNCNLVSRSSGIRIGFLDQNTVRNILISNVNITNSNRGIGIFVRDEGSIENVTISHVNIDTRLHTGDWWGNGEPIHISAVPGTADRTMGQIKNVTFRDVNCRGENGILLFGSEKSNIEDITFDNLTFVFADSKLNDVAGGNIDLRGAMGDRQLFKSDIAAMYGQYVRNVRLSNTRIQWQNVKESYFTHGIHIRNFENLQVSNTKAAAAPSNPSLPVVLLEDGRGFSTDLEKNLIKLNKVAY